MAVSRCEAERFHLSLAYTCPPLPTPCSHTPFLYMSESRFSWAQLWWRLLQKPLLYVLALSSGLAVPTLTVCASLDRSYLQPSSVSPRPFLQPVSERTGLQDRDQVIPSSPTAPGKELALRN